MLGERLDKPIIGALVGFPASAIINGLWDSMSAPVSPAA